MPMQWILCSGRPSAALAGFRFRRSPRSAGIYDGPALARTRIVVIIERVGDQAELQRLLEIVSTRSAEDVAAALRKPRAKTPARAKVSRRSASPRRAAPAR